MGWKDSYLTGGRIAKSTVSTRCNYYQVFFFLSCLNSKRGHLTTFQRKTRYTHTHTYTDTKTHTIPTQRPFRTGPLDSLSLQGWGPLNSSCNPALASSHLTGSAGGQGNPQRRAWGQGNHGCDWPPVDDADRV